MFFVYHANMRPKPRIDEVSKNPEVRHRPRRGNIRAARLRAVVGVRWVAERRVLRRASHQSLKVPVFREQSFDALSQNNPATSYARGDWDADYRRDEGWPPADPEHPSSDGDRNEARVSADPDHTAPLPTVREMTRPEPVPLEDDSWDARPHHRTDLRLGPPPSNTLTFKPVSRPWYGSMQRVLVFVLVAAVIALIVAGVLLVLRTSGSDTDETTTVPSTATTNATSQPAPPPNTGDGQSLAPGVPGDLPPPPPPEETSPPPPATGGGYRWYPSREPDTSATGRPQIPAPISVAPLPRQAPEPGHVSPGDAPRRHRGFF